MSSVWCLVFGVLYLVVSLFTFNVSLLTFHF